MNKLKKAFTVYNIIFASIMALFLIWGFFAFRDYGISWDEEVQRNRGLAGLKTVIEMTMGESAVPEALNREEIVKRQPGSLGIKAPVVLAEYVTGFKMTNGATFRMYHLYNFLLFFISAFFAYWLLLLLGFDQKYALFGLVLYIISPRILADSFYNNKDLAFLALYTMILALSVSLVKHFRWSILVLLSLVTVLCFGVRTIAPFPVVIFALYYLVRETDKKNVKTIIKPLLRLLAAVVICLVFYVLLTPKAWVDFTGSIASKMADVTTFSHGGFDLIAGRIYNRLELPWYYLPFTIILTVPCFYLVFTVVGALTAFAKGFSEERFLENNVFLWLLLWQLIAFFAYCMILKPMQYNYWRHFYFLHIYMVIFTLYGVRWAIERNSMLRAFTRLFAVCFVFLTISWIGANHPYEYMYFNPMFRDTAAKESDNDYWKVSYQGLLSQISDAGSADVYMFPTLTGNQLFGEAGFENFHQEALEYSAKYRLTEGNPGDNAFYEILKTVEVDDRIAQSLIRRVNYGNVLRKYFLEEGTVNGVNNGSEIEWTVKPEGTRECLIAHIPEKLQVKEIDFLYGEENSQILSAAAYISGNGSEYLRVKETNILAEDEIYAISGGGDYLPEYVMLSYEKTVPSVSMAIRVFGDEDREKDGIFYKRYEAAEDIAAIAVSGDAKGLEALTDGKEETVYEVSAAMNGNEFVEISLKQTEALKGLHIDGGAYPMKEGRHLVLQGRNAAGDYEELPYYYAGADDYVFENAGCYDTYRILQKGISKNAFAISEIGLIK